MPLHLGTVRQQKEEQTLSYISTHESKKPHRELPWEVVIPAQNACRAKEVLKPRFQTAFFGAPLWQDDSRPLCGRQSCHFLETASLHPPPAALQRFPFFRCWKKGTPRRGHREFFLRANKVSFFAKLMQRAFRVCGYETPLFVAAKVPQSAT